jgi:hypothetical protein
LHYRGCNTYVIWNSIAHRRVEMTNYERIKAMSLEEMAAFVEAAGRNTCHKICVYRQGGMKNV